MKFENKGKWFNESEDTDKDMLNDEQQELAMEDDASDLLAEDELNLADEDIDDDSEGIFNDEEQVDEACKYRNEVRYIDPANLDKYSKDEIEEVTKVDGTKAYKRKSTSSPAMQTKPAQQNKATVNSPQQKEQAVQEKNSLISDFIRLKGKRDSLAQENKRIGKQAKDANNYPADAQKKVIGNQKKIDALEKEMSMKKARIDELDKAISSYKDPKQLKLL